MQTIFNADWVGGLPMIIYGDLTGGWAGGLPGGISISGLGENFIVYFDTRRFNRLGHHRSL